jgi:TldD protein
MRNILEDLISRQSGYVELRYHEHQTNALMAQKGRIDQASSQTQHGIAVRVLDSGAWGFSSTSIPEASAIQKAIDSARASARQLSRLRKEKIQGLAPADLSTDTYSDAAYTTLQNMSLEEKINHVIKTEQTLAKQHPSIHTAVVRYHEIFEKKIIVTSDGANCMRELVRPEFRTIAFAGQGAEQIIAGRAVGITGGWNELFQHEGCLKIVEETAQEAIDLLKAPHAEGGLKTVILAPSLVGLLCHEAIGHTVEADFVQAGSVAQGMLGKRVGSDLVNLYDAGWPDAGQNPGGLLPFDDEGVRCTPTPIIKNGILSHYLHDRESAAKFNDKARGNARAWTYADEPLIRMTNTWLAPGQSKLEQMISEVPDGLLVMGAGSGQADATGEFMFGASCAREIKNGKLGKLYREVTLSGLAFQVLQTIDAISDTFLWDLGSGYCGKGQAAKVDAGGPHARCKIKVGGRQA